MKFVVYRVKKVRFFVLELAQVEVKYAKAIF